MNPPGKKSPEIKGLRQQFTRQAKPARSFKPVIAPSKSAVALPKLRQPLAPPVYRPQAKPIVAQTKTAGSAQMKTHPVAPPAYRPQPVPRVLQTKLFVGHHPIKPAEQKRVISPVCRPQPGHKVLQTKPATHPPHPFNTSATANRLKAVPAYRPQPHAMRAPTLSGAGSALARPRSSDTKTGLKNMWMPLAHNVLASAVIQRSAASSDTMSDEIMSYAPKSNSEEILDLVTVARKKITWYSDSILHEMGLPAKPDSSTQCPGCGKTGAEFQLDHQNPWRPYVAFCLDSSEYEIDSGTFKVEQRRIKALYNDPGNLWWLCSKCNGVKSDKVYASAKALMDDAKGDYKSAQTKVSRDKIIKLVS